MLKPWQRANLILAAPFRTFDHKGNSFNNSKGAKGDGLSNIDLPASLPPQVSVPIVSNESCKQMFFRAGRHEVIPHIFMCAGYDNGGRDSCQVRVLNGGETWKHGRKSAEWVGGRTGGQKCRLPFYFFLLTV